MPACKLEELARRKVERHIRLPVRIDDDQVVPLATVLEKRPPVGRVDMETRIVVEPEEAPARHGHGWVELDPLDRDTRVEQPVHPRDRATGLSDHPHLARPM